MRKSTDSGVKWAECSLIIGTGCRVQVFSLILDSSVVLSASIQSAGDWVSGTPGSNPTFCRGTQLVSFRLTTANMYIARARCESQLTVGVKWAECSLIIGTGCRVQVFSLILDCSVDLSATIQSAGDLVSGTPGSNSAFCRGTQLFSFRFSRRFGFWDPGFKACILQRNTTCLLLIWILLACARASKLTTTNMYIARARCESQLTVGSSGLNGCWS